MGKLGKAWTSEGIAYIRNGIESMCKAKLWRGPVKHGGGKAELRDAMATNRIGVRCDAKERRRMPRNYYTGRGLEIHPNLYHTNKRSLFGKYELHPPGPNDLTEQKILERMSRIYVGDRVKFNSMKECYTASQVGRHSATIPTIGEVVEHCGGYLMLRLRNGLLESCNYYDILSVNGKTWPYSIKRADSLSVEVEV